MKDKFKEIKTKKSGWVGPKMIADFRAVKQMAIPIPRNKKLSEADSKKLKHLVDKLKETLKKYDCKPVPSIDAFMTITEGEKYTWFKTTPPYFEPAIKAQFEQCILPHIGGLID